MITRFGPQEEMLRRRFPSPAIRDRARQVLAMLEEIVDREPIDLEALGDALELAITGKKPKP